MIGRQTDLDVSGECSFLRTILMFYYSKNLGKLKLQRNQPLMYYGLFAISEMGWNIRILTYESSFFYVGRIE
jgi:hypothetical protein